MTSKDVTQQEFCVNSCACHTYGFDPVTGWVGAQIVAVLRQIEVELANHKNLTLPKRRGKGAIWSARLAGIYRFCEEARGAYG